LFLGDPMRSIFGTLVAPLQRFLEQEAASGVLLFVSALAALLLANGPFGDAYAAAVHGSLPLLRRRVPIHAIVNDGLMTLFFFLVGMEIKRELVAGELRTVSSAVLPGIAAAGGMLVPAAIYATLNPEGAAARGWAIPMATDIAFSVGCLALLKKRVPAALVVFLTAFAIFDDIGGIAVIAVFYTRGLSPKWLLVAAAVGVVLWAAARRGARTFAVYGAGGILLWISFQRAGLHPTLAGVLSGLLVPASPPAVAPLDAWIDRLHVPVAFGIVPLFALVNSGVALQGLGIGELLRPVALGVALGLFAGKQAGITSFTWAAVKLRLARTPGDATLRQLHGVAVVGGIGFTVALFLADLAFADEPALLAQAKLGILAGSLLSGAIGALLLLLGPGEER
jgi:NhaA family Na+:H+ antiporter